MNGWKSASCVKKLNKPILTCKDIPYDASLVFNAGVVKFKGKYVMVFRNDYGTTEELFGKGKRFAGTNLGVAFSDDGYNWNAMPQPWFQWKTDEIQRAYDPRLTVIDDELYICMAIDTKHGIRGAVAKIIDFDNPPQIISMSVPDNRNMVLFPERINGNYIRLERPMPVYFRDGEPTYGLFDFFDLWLSESPDLKYWGESRLVLDVDAVPFANDKVGPGAPPIKTDKGWLMLFHAVERDNDRGKNGWEQKWEKVYYTGIALLDLDDPSKVIGMSKEPLIVSDLPYEFDGGFRTDVIFPGGMILEDDGEVKIYYGAADTVECVATANVNDLIDLCLQK
ncbi:MAG: glycoside hydrolase family 130 protein [Clostridia bacterium]|nr:glycoside hydrolase family 130 protein [Clostridia bacterium]